MGGVDALPADVRLVRTTREFDETSVPTGLLRAHRVAAGVWGLLVVLAGSLTFVFDEDSSDSGRLIVARGRQVIPPDVPHHVVMSGPVRFVIEFYEIGSGGTVTT